MPEQTFGGDDDSSGGDVEEPKKLDLSKYGLSPDSNIRDIFWKIIGSYAATKEPGVELSTNAHDRFALMRTAVSILSRPHNNQHGVSSKFIVLYSLMMMLDGKWYDALSEFLEITSEEKMNVKKEVIITFKKLAGQDKYKNQIIEYFMQLIRKRDTVSIGLEYLAGIENTELIMQLNKELIILARGDIGKNQMNAINAILLIKEDENVRKTLIILLSHWDSEARLIAAQALIGIKSEDIHEAAKKRLSLENDPEIKKILQRLSNK